MKIESYWFSEFPFHCIRLISTILIGLARHEPIVKFNQKSVTEVNEFIFGFIFDDFKFNRKGFEVMRSRKQCNRPTVTV